MTQHCHCICFRPGLAIILQADFNCQQFLNPIKYSRKAFKPNTESWDIIPTDNRLFPSKLSWDIYLKPWTWSQLISFSYLSVIIPSSLSCLTIISQSSSSHLAVISQSSHRHLAVILQSSHNLLTVISQSSKRQIMDSLQY